MNLVKEAKDTRDRLCTTAAALGLNCLCNHGALSLVELMSNIKEIAQAINQTVVIPGSVKKKQVSEEEEEKEEDRKRSRSSSSRSRSPSPYQKREQRRRTSPRKHDEDPKSIYVRYIPEQEAFVGRESVKAEEASLRRLFDRFGKVERAYVWAYKGKRKDRDGKYVTDESGRPRIFSIPMARVVFDSEEAKQRVLVGEARETAERNGMFISATKF